MNLLLYKKRGEGKGCK